MPDNPMICIEHLKKVYGSGASAVAALDDVSLTIRKGDIHGIIGMSGAGKSTLIRCINRLDTPTEGRILIDGQDILAMNEKNLRAMRKRVSMIFQQFNLLMQKTVARNVRYPLEIAGVPKAQANKRVEELLEIVGLSHKANAYPAQLSGGQKQRVAIARALASDPEVLLCDEATSALDPMTTQSILSLLQDINRRLGITVVVITHEMAVIRQDLQPRDHHRRRQDRRGGRCGRGVHAHAQRRRPPPVRHRGRGGRQRRIQRGHPAGVRRRIG